MHPCHPLLVVLLKDTLREQLLLPGLDVSHPPSHLLEPRVVLRPLLEQGLNHIIIALPARLKALQGLLRGFVNLDRGCHASVVPIADMAAMEINLSSSGTLLAGRRLQPTAAPPSHKAPDVAGPKVQHFRQWWGGSLSRSLRALGPGGGRPKHEDVARVLTSPRPFRYRDLAVAIHFGRRAPLPLKCRKVCHKENYGRSSVQEQPSRPTKGFGETARRYSSTSTQVRLAPATGRSPAPARKVSRDRSAVDRTLPGVPSVDPRGRLPTLGPCLSEDECEGFGRDHSS